MSIWQGMEGRDAGGDSGRPEQKPVVWTLSTVSTNMSDEWKQAEDGICKLEAFYLPTTSAQCHWRIYRRISLNCLAFILTSYGCCFEGWDVYE